MAPDEQLTKLGDFTQVDKQKGSNPGGTYTHKSGKKYYLKFPAQKAGADAKIADEMSKNEVLAAKLYQLAGVKVPEVFLIDDGNGHLGIASEIEETFQTAMIPNAKPPENRRAPRTGIDWPNLPGVKEGLAVDAWLANWDVVGLEYDNIGTYMNPETHRLEAFRVDTGGALIYRAQGSLKGKLFGDTAGEVDTLRGKNPQVVNEQAAYFFSRVEDSKIKEGVQRLANISPEKIRDLVMKHGPGNDKEKQELANKLIARRNNLMLKFNIKPEIAPTASIPIVPPPVVPIAKVPTSTEKAAEFDGIIATHLATRCSASDTTYRHFNAPEDSAPIYRVKHGGMHASRAAANSGGVIDLLKMSGYQPAQTLTDRDRYLIEAAVMFHDAGRERDSGDDQKAWEEHGAELCAQHLREKGYSEEEIAKAKEAISHKDDPAVQARNVYALVVAASDSLDWGRSHGSDISTEYLPKILQDHVPKEILEEFAKRCKQVAAEQGDSPRSQFGISGNFNITKKKEFEHSGQCYSKTRALHDKHFLGFEAFCKQKLAPKKIEPQTPQEKLQVGLHRSQPHPSQEDPQVGLHMSQPHPSQEDPQVELHMLTEKCIFSASSKKKLQETDIELLKTWCTKTLPLVSSSPDMTKKITELQGLLNKHAGFEDKAPRWESTLKILSCLKSLGAERFFSENTKKQVSVYEDNKNIIKGATKIIPEAAEKISPHP